jgi:hypothetical protein
MIFHEMIIAVFLTCLSVTGTGALLLALSQPIQAQTTISRFTIDGGGGSSHGGITEINGTIGQPDAGQLSGGDIKVNGGFWVGGGTMGLPSPTPSPTENLPFATPTPTDLLPPPTPTPPPPTDFDVKPDLLDGFIDARDLAEWVSRVKESGGGPGLLNEFSLYWHGDFPIAAKTQDKRE